MSWQNNRAEKEFQRSMAALYRQIVTVIGKKTDPDTVSRRLKILSNQPEFHRAAAAMALRMTAKTNASISKSWREAARKAGRGNDLYAGIMSGLKENPGRFFETIRENADLIRSVPDNVANWIAAKMQTESMKGRRASDIAEEIMKEYPDMLAGQAQLIARTETSKTQLALTQSRCEELEIRWYVWRTAMDSRRRDAHADMEGILVAWDDPPNPEALFPHAGAKAYGKYHAGGTFNCRCYPEPIVTLNAVSFPAKVHRKGKIVSMTRAQFEKLCGNGAVVA